MRDSSAGHMIAQVYFFWKESIECGIAMEDSDSKELASQGLTASPSGYYTNFNGKVKTSWNKE